MQQKHHIVPTSLALVLAITLSLGLGIFLNAAPAFAATYSWPTLEQGSSGENVYSIQLMLQAHGYSITADGSYGPQTASTVSAFQSANGLSADGSVGPQTWPVLIVTTQQGSTGAAVQALQRQLNAHGASLSVDGDFGTLTTTALKNYQSSHQLTVDGSAGPQTWSSLVSTSGGGGGGSTLWGVDTTSTISSSFLSSVENDYGKPDFVGRYLDQETGYVTGLTSSEASYIHGQSIHILLIESDHGGDTGSSGTTKGNEAVQQAKALGVPSGVTLIADIETSSSVDSAFIEDWYSAVSAAGYKLGYYANPLPGSSGFNSAFCASGSTIISNAVIYSAEPSHSATTKASAPAYAPDSPTCGGQTLAWQYALSNTAKVNADFDEARTSLTLW